MAKENSQLVATPSSTESVRFVIANIGPTLTKTPSLFRFLFLVFVFCATWNCAPARPTPPPHAPQGPADETDQIINSLLSDRDGSHSVVPKSTAAKQPAASVSATDSFDDDRERIRTTVAKWDHGTGATLRFLKETTGEKLSLIFVDETAPVFKPDAGLWMIQATARVTGGKIVGHFVLFLKDLRAAKYRGDDHTKEAIMAVLMGEQNWDGQNPETAWSVNRESWCEVVLRKTAENGVEGDFKARLVDNKGTGYINIDSGYLFIKQ